MSIDRLHGRYTTCSSADPLGVAGVGTFPDGLSLAVAPASKGLFPQPVSMSGAESRVSRGGASMICVWFHSILGMRALNRRAAKRALQALPSRPAIEGFFEEALAAKN